MVSVMTLRVWPVSGVHLSAPLDYAPQQGPFQSNQIYQLRIKMHINNICKRLYTKELLSQIPVTTSSLRSLMHV